MQVNLILVASCPALAQSPPLPYGKSQRLASAPWSHNIFFLQIWEGPLILQITFSGQASSTPGVILLMNYPLHQGWLFEREGTFH